MCTCRRSHHSYVCDFVHFQILSQIFSQILIRNYSAPSLEMPDDFFKLVACGVQNLHQNKRTNVIYSLAKAVVTMRVDGSDSLLPVKRMPMGIIDYAVTFFTVFSVQQVCLHNVMYIFMVKKINCYFHRCSTFLQTLFAEETVCNSGVAVEEEEGRRVG